MLCVCEGVWLSVWVQVYIFEGEGWLCGSILQSASKGNTLMCEDCKPKFL